MEKLLFPRTPSCKSDGYHLLIRESPSFAKFSPGRRSCCDRGARRKLARRELRIQSEIMCNEKTLSFIPEPQPVYRLVVVLRAG